ncbi:PaaI family thioesterase [Myxococcota bacterium]|nr:PaaI family thioesterase [Myxococcota bacterium]
MTVTEPDLTGESGWAPTLLPTDVGIVSYVSGDPTGDRLRVRYYKDDSNRLRGKVWFGPGTQGPPGHAHGGSIASILDEAMGGATWMGGHLAVALELTSRFRKLIPLETVATLTAEITEVDGRKVRTCGSLVGPGGVVYAEGEGLFLALDPTRFGDMAERAMRMLAQSRASEPG